MIKFVITMDSINVFLNGKNVLVNKKSLLYPQVLTAIENQDEEALSKLVNLGEYLMSQNENFTIIGNNLYFKNEDVAELIGKTIVNRIMASVLKGNFNVQAELKFIENAVLNPFKDIRQELYEFMDTNELQLTEDGCFLACKKVTHDYLDIYTRTMDNSVGATVKQDIDQCDTDRNVECSKGLHFCSRSYISNYATDERNARVVIVKVNPKDVVAIPRDYNFAKGRACEYKVIDEVKRDLSDLSRFHKDNGILPQKDTNNEVIDKIISELKDLLGFAEDYVIDVKDFDKSIAELLGADELDIIEYVMALEEVFNIEIDESEFIDYLDMYTINFFIECVNNHLKAKVVEPDVSTLGKEVVTWVTHGDKGKKATKEGVFYCVIPIGMSAKDMIEKVSEDEYKNISRKIEKDVSTVERALVRVTSTDGTNIKSIWYTPRASLFK